MKIVVEVSEKDYLAFCLQFDNGILEKTVPSHRAKIAIANGTPLPKGHGDLKDVSKINYQQGCFVDSTGSPLPIIHKIATIEMIRDWLPTIIEADEEGADE